MTALYRGRSHRPVLIHWGGKMSFIGSFVKGLIDGFNSEFSRPRGYDVGEFQSHMEMLARQTGLHLAWMRRTTAFFRVDFQGIDYCFGVKVVGERLGLHAVSNIEFP